MTDFVEFFAEFAWMWAVGMMLIATLPIWFIPYTAYRAWAYFQRREI
jgi:hypothetical protein